MGFEDLAGTHPNFGGISQAIAAAGVPDLGRNLSESVGIVGRGGDGKA